MCGIGYEGGICKWKRLGVNGDDTRSNYFCLAHPLKAKQVHTECHTSLSTYLSSGPRIPVSQTLQPATFFSLTTLQ
jgi:hypothetical protein